jgi:ribosomal protein S18 acetylase RimI-like enzyme
MNQKINLRRAKPEDIDQFLKVENTVVNRKLFTILPNKDDARKDALQDIIKYFVYFIEKDGKTAGTISYELKNKTRAYLFGVVVVPEFQRQGVAKKATEMILKMLKDFEAINLVVHPKNDKAIHLYQSLGFEKVGKQIENYFGDGEPRIKMVFKKHGK